MSPPLFDTPDADARFFSRTDPDEPLGSFSAHPFLLDEQLWPTVEHYYQAMKFSGQPREMKIAGAASPQQARRMGRMRFRGIRADWSKVKVAYMTRALYTKCLTYPEIAEQLLASDQRLVESSQYDYYWGCGRDRRGTNMYGQVLMNIRDKLRAERQA